VQDPQFQEVNAILAEVRSLLQKRRGVFERFLLSGPMRALIGVLAAVLVGVALSLMVYGEGFVRFWVQTPWMWLVVASLVILGGGWLKLRAWKDLVRESSWESSLFDAVGKSVLVMAWVLIGVFVVLHVWLIGKGAWGYLISLWGIGLGLVYVMYGTFLSVGALLGLGVWSLVGGMVTLFVVPHTIAQVGVAVLVVFALGYVGLFGYLQVRARLRR